MNIMYLVNSFSITGTKEWLKYDLTPLYFSRVINLKGPFPIFIAKGPFASIKLSYLFVYT